MNEANIKVNEYLVRGCGRCKLYDTPDCKVHNWEQELKALRKILLETELVEEIKWSMPCYTHNKKNILILAAFKEYCSINFFKGSLLKDPKMILETAGDNSQSGRLIRFTNLKDVKKLESSLKEYIQEAIEIEESGKKVKTKDVSEYNVPEELESIFKKDSVFKKAFQALTPGRQKGYLIYFSQPKQSKTRIDRIKKYRPLILEGKGFNDSYKEKINR